jgi:hypothetical protein
MRAAGLSSGVAGLTNILNKGSDATLQDWRQFGQGLMTLQGIGKGAVQKYAMKKGQGPLSINNGDQTLSFKSEADFDAFKNRRAKHGELGKILGETEEAQKAAAKALAEAKTTGDAAKIKAAQDAFDAANLNVTNAKSDIAKSAQQFQDSGIDIDAGVSGEGRSMWSRIRSPRSNGKWQNPIDMGEGDLKPFREDTMRAMTAAEAKNANWLKRYGHRLNTTEDWFRSGKHGYVPDWMLA